MKISFKLVRVDGKKGFIISPTKEKSVHTLELKRGGRTFFHVFESKTKKDVVIGYQTKKGDRLAVGFIYFFDRGLGKERFRQFIEDML